MPPCRHTICTTHQRVLGNPHEQADRGNDCRMVSRLWPRGAHPTASPIERGMHALRSGLGVREYARASGREKQADQVSRERYAAEVLACANSEPLEFLDATRQLVEI